MKVKTQQGSYYLQKYDVGFITENIEKIPPSFMSALAPIKDREPINTRDQFAFVGPFTDPASIRWLDELHYIVSYNSYVGVPPSAISRQIKKLQRSLTSLIQTYNKLPEKEMYRPAYELQTNIERHRIKSLGYMRDHRSYKIEFELPKGYTPPPQPKKTSFFARLFGTSAP